MKARICFSSDLLTVLRKNKGVRIRAGTGAHRFIGIWFVVVEDGVFVRSWSVKPDGWYRTFLKEPLGAIRVGDCELAVRAVPVKSERLRSAVDRAYLDKYNTAGAIKYAKDLARAKSRATNSCRFHLPDSNFTDRQSKNRWLERKGFWGPIVQKRYLLVLTGAHSFTVWH